MDFINITELKSYIASRYKHDVNFLLDINNDCYISIQLKSGDVYQYDKIKKFLWFNMNGTLSMLTQELNNFLIMHRRIEKINKLL